jgi:putative tryptophan/tyrosine transport system substrate-binding protein
MQRRAFFTLLGGLLGWPIVVQAQQKGMRIIGVLGPNPKVFESLNLEQDLTKLGWLHGRDFRLAFKWSYGSNEALQRLAAELVELPADVIFATGDHAVIAAQRATTVIPIVAVTDDMVGSKLVRSMARPDGNTTGISILASELDVKRLELLHELVPQAKRIGILADPTTIATGPQLAAAARVLDLQLVTVQAANSDAVAGALRQLATPGIGAVNVLASPILDDARDLIVERLNAARLPAIFQWPDSAEAGGLAGYGPRLSRVIYAGMEMIDKLLRGGRPAEIPVRQPTHFELAINLKTAKVLGLAVPESLLARADKVIE